MKQKVKLLGIVGIVTSIILSALLIPVWKLGQWAPWEIPAQGLALAADENAQEDDPFDDEGPLWEESETTVSDPLEPINRAFFVFNDKTYFWVLKPAARVYRTFIPLGVRTCIRNAHYNILAPIRVVNTLLQGKIRGTGIETTRFIVNSTLGVGGMFDIAATHFNLPTYDEDFGQTLGVYGMGPGFFINWPILGPSTVRDSIGLGGDYFLSPLIQLAPDAEVYFAIRAGITVNNTSLRIGDYEDLKESALDPYVAVRNAYIQYRRKEIKE
jgi:phospholipid-binding lipoprotein MlaA